MGFSWAKCFIPLLLCCSISDFCLASPLTLTILHTNDVHSRFLQTNKYSGSCAERDVARNKCYGGFSRLNYKVKEIRNTHPNVVYLSAGDYFQGTVWYTLFKWDVVARFVRQLNHTAMAIGNHEFDDGIAGLVPFIDAVGFPVLATNIDASREPTIQGKFQKSIIVQYEGWKVGIIGYTTTETPRISKPGDLIFEDEVKAVAREAKSLHDQGIKILIAVGHAGYDVDMKVATVPYVDVVVGGHTNTFLYSGTAPDIETPLGQYPTIIKQANGRSVPVVTAYAFGKYLGYLNVTFDEDGEVTHWAGSPILLNGSVPQDPTMEAELLDTGRSVIERTKEEVGKTRVFLDGQGPSCRLRECNLGSVIADAMVEMSIKYADDIYWTDVTIALMNGGGVRSSIDETANNGSVTLDDIMTVFPFANTVDLIQIRGKYIREAFEFSVDEYDPKGFHLDGKFLQVSGIRIVFDITKPVGQRVSRLDVLCRKCRVPEYEPLEDAEIYKIAMPTYLITGGNGYTMIRDNIIAQHITGTLDTDMFLEYLQRRSPIIQGLDGRISFSTENSSSCRLGGANSNSKLSSNSYIIFGIFLINFLYLRLSHIGK